MSCQNPANVAPFLTRGINAGHQNGNPQGQRTGTPAYFCCACGFGPMICALYSACIACQHGLDSNCEIDIIADKSRGTKPQGEHHAEPSVRHDVRQTVNPSNQVIGQSEQPAEPHRQQLTKATEEPTFHPGVIQGAGVIPIPGQSNDGYMLDRYISSPPGVIERLANGFANNGRPLEDIEFSEACRKLGSESDVWEYPPLDQMELDGYDGYDFMDHAQ